MQCCCCCCQQPARDGQDEQEREPPAGQPDQSRRCTRYRVTFESLDVSQIDDGFIGGALETEWTLSVNGQTKTYTNQNLNTGTHQVGKTFFVDVPANTSTIRIDVSGTEADPVTKGQDDPLPGFNHVWGQADNWGAGAQSGSGSNGTITYTLNYNITCAEEDATFAVSRQALVEYGEAKAEQRGVDATDEAALSWALSRMQRDNWDLLEATDDQFLFEGQGTLPKRVTEQFG